MSKERRKGLSLAERVRVIEEYETTKKSQRLLAEEFGVGKTQIQLTIKRKDEYITAYAENGTPNRKRLCNRLNSEELERGVWTWYTTARSMNLPVTGSMIREKAREIADSLGITEFKASAGWLNKFRIRHNIKFARVHVDRDLATSQVTRFPALADGFNPNDVFSVDGNGLLQRTSLEKSVPLKGNLSTDDKRIGKEPIPTGRSDQTDITGKSQNPQVPSTNLANHVNNPYAYVDIGNDSPMHETLGDYWEKQFLSDLPDASNQQDTSDSETEEKCKELSLSEREKFLQEYERTRRNQQLLAQMSLNLSRMSREKHRELSLADRVKVIQEYESTNKSQRILAEEFGVGKTQIQHTIKRKEEYMNAFAENAAPTRKRLFTHLTSEELERGVWSWFMKARSMNIPVSGPMIRETARKIADALGITDFKASVGWLNKFRIRHNITFTKAGFEQDNMSDWFIKFPALASGCFPVSETQQTFAGQALDFKGDCFISNKSDEDHLASSGNFNQESDLGTCQSSDIFSSTHSDLDREDEDAVHDQLDDGGEVDESRSVPDLPNMSTRCYTPDKQSNDSSPCGQAQITDFTSAAHWANQLQMFCLQNDIADMALSQLVGYLQKASSTNQ